MWTNLKGWTLYRIIYLIVLLIVMSVYFIFRALYVLLGMGDLFLVQWTFLGVSILLSIFAFLNYLVARKFDTARWKRYSLFLFVAMVFGTLGDFLLAGVLPIALDLFMFGVVAFAFGQVFYLLALRQLSTLIINPTGSISNNGGSPRFNRRNLIIWLAYIISCAAGYMLALFNPAIFELSVGGLCYFLLFVSVLAFALTKFFDDYPLPFKVSLFFGFLLFFISDIVLAWNKFYTPILFGSLIISITYLLGQLLVHLTPLLKASSNSSR